MFTIRPYTEKDAAACGECCMKAFSRPLWRDCDKILLRDYAQVLIEKCNFTYVAEADDGQVVGFICGKYSKSFDRPWQTDMRAKSTMACGAGCSSNTI